MPSPDYALNVQISGNPSAGNEFIFSNSLGGPAKFHAIIFRLTTSAAVANRTPTLILQDSNLNRVMRITSGAVQTASTVQEYSFMSGYAGLNASAGGVVSVPLPDIIIPVLWRFSSLTAGIDAADQYSNIFALLEF